MVPRALQIPYCFGFSQFSCRYISFVLNTGGNLLYLLVYVDDIILIGNDDTMIHKFMQLLAHQFCLKDLGHLSYFLGVEVIPNDHGSPLKDPIEYRTIVGSLQYLLITRPDIAYALYHDSSLSLHAFSDSDWAGNKDDLTSTSAYVVYRGRNPISWSSKKQRIVDRSFTEAEYRSVAAIVSELN
ncbi:Retrovirus-related Pol polyprotein from transposon RE1 [Vitis vinifera]|uniref:Retrovirus-related Pol polyprotein from transposon RE1 n=1 Tax=Vitis vinifera TaxID=29760 RepID=A0A438HF33_VITVI|nr:Retrovirus-related Pol polyprotein from transposon RE1 [Vitis vinifera]